MVSYGLIVGLMVGFIVCLVQVLKFYTDSRFVFLGQQLCQWTWRSWVKARRAGGSVSDAKFRNEQKQRGRWKKMEEGRKEILGG